jgi:glycosyltransferase involved in cell wall biosynthesis
MPNEAMTRPIFILTPSDERCGPVNVAVELFNATSPTREAKIFGLRHSRNDKYSIITVIKWFSFLLLVFQSKRNVLIHSHGLRPDFVGLLAKLLFRSAWVSTVHIDVLEDMRYNHGRFGLLVSRMWLIALKQADKVISLNPYLAAKLQAQIRRKVDFVFNGRQGPNNSELYVRRKQSGFNPKCPRIGYLGNFIELKNVRCIPGLNLTDETPLFLAGRGPLLDEVLYGLQKCNSKFTYLGFITNVDLFFDNVDVLILPSFTEAMPLVVVEAAARGVPCIVTKLPQFKDSIDSFCTQIEVWNPETFSIALRTIAAEYSFHSQRAFEAWSMNFSPESMARGYFDYFDSIP